MEPKVHRFAKMWLLRERGILLEGLKSENVDEPLVLPVFLVRSPFRGELGRSWRGGVICTVGRIKEGYRGLKKENKQFFERNNIK